MSAPVCSCGEVVPPFSPAEDAHFVFATRTDGTRSNLGFCPKKWGMDKAINKARQWGVGATYQGRKV